MPDFQPDLASLDRVFNQAPGMALQTPDDWNQAAARTQAAQALAHEQRAKAQQAAEARADEQLIRQIGQETGGDPHQMIARLRVVNPRVAMKFDDEWGKVQKQTADRLKIENDNERAQIDKYLGLVKMTETQPELWPTVRASWVKDDPTMEKYLPTAYDPQKIKGVYAMGLQAKDITAMDAKSLEYRAKGDWATSAAWAFADPTMDAQEVADTAKALIQNGYPPDIVNRFDWQHWTPDFAARALEMGRTPEQRADAAAAATTQAETVAHHRATEANAAAQLAVSQGNLAVSRQNAQRLAAQATKPTGSGAAGTTAKAGGRGVTSGDANRIADFDTSLDDLGEVRRVLSAPGMTGAVSTLEAWTPDVVTDLTGYGTAAKQRQAVIDRVKQVIGKALEGGVLRKEDEYKYEKILPTIKDAAPIVKSKLDGLEAAITQRRRTLIESLGDAGYNVSAYEQRTTTRTTGGSTTSATPDYDFDPKSGKFVKRSK